MTSYGDRHGEWKERQRKTKDKDLRRCRRIDPINRGEGGSCGGKSGQRGTRVRHLSKDVTA